MESTEKSCSTVKTQSFHRPLQYPQCIRWYFCRRGITCRMHHGRTNHLSWAAWGVCRWKNMPTHSSLKKLQPVMDEADLLRLGGRIIYSSLPKDIVHPLIIPARHHVAIQLVRHHHERVQHQGRHFTEGAVHTSSLWITCRKVWSKVADLPQKHLHHESPFTYVGMDVFGSWEVVMCLLWGGSSNSRR